MATLASGVRPDEYLPPGSAVALVVEARTPWQLFWSRFRTDRAAVAGLVTIAILVMLAVAAPLVSGFVGHGPNQLFGNMTTALGLPRGPSSQFWFGADSVGRDVFVRTIYGARTSLTVAFLATGAATLIGVTLGLVAGFFRGWVDTAISRAIDIVLSLPLLLLAIGIAAACSVSPNGCLDGLVQPGLRLVVVVIGLFTWPQIARIVRGQTFSLQEREFVEAARSFLGLGIPQSTPSWGGMIAQAAEGQLFTYAWWMMLFPGLFLLLTTLAFNLVGDGLRDALGPGRPLVRARLRRSRRGGRLRRSHVGTAPMGAGKGAP